MHVYDENVARHYAAYRPPLHALIVSDALEERSFESGLDVGCGAGASSIAAAAYCERVIGVDASAAMLAGAQIHPRVEYRLTDGGALPIEDGEVGLVTLAGVLPYLERRWLCRELRRVCGAGATLLVYDFQVDLNELRQLFSLDRVTSAQAYDHATNLATDPCFATESVDTRQLRLELDAEQAAHLLLANAARFRAIAAHFNTNDPFAVTAAAIEGSNWSRSVEATMWRATHRLRSG